MSRDVGPGFWLLKVIIRHVPQFPGENSIMSLEIMKAKQSHV